MPEKGKRPATAGRAIWSGTITFGLVSIPVDLFAAIRPRATSMKMVDREGRPLGRRYFCPKDGEALDAADLVRGFETRSGKRVVVTDEELEAIAPEKSRDIDLRQFVPLAQISPAFFDRPYFLLPAGRSTKAYHLLVATMQRTGRAGIATFVMREHEYLVAIVAAHGVLRAETMRFASELRSPADMDLPAPSTPSAALVKKFARAIADLERDDLDRREMADWYADEIHELARKKRRKDADVVERPEEAEDDEDEATPSADVIDLMKIIRERLAKNAAVGSELDAVERTAGRRAARKGRTDRKQAGRTSRHKARKAA